MNLRFSLVFAVAFMAIATLGAGFVNAPSPTREFCGSPQISNLVIDRRSDAGDISVNNSKDHLFIQIASENGWLLAKSEVHVSTTRQGIPQTNAGVPLISKFADQRSYQSEATGDAFKLSLDQWKPGTTLYIAVHAVTVQIGRDQSILQNATAWGEGASFNDASAMYIKYNVQACGTTAK